MSDERKEYWDKAREVTDKIADEVDVPEIMTTLSDVAMELGQYALRLAHNESLYKDGSYMDFFKYLSKVSLWGMVAADKLEDQDGLRCIIEDTVLKEMEDRFK